MKILKNCQDNCRQFSRGTNLLAPFLGGSDQNWASEERPPVLDFPADVQTLTRRCLEVKSFSPLPGPQGKQSFRCVHPQFLARTSMTRRVLEKVCAEEVCVYFLVPSVGLGCTGNLPVFQKVVFQWLCSASKRSATYVHEIVPSSL